MTARAKYVVTLANVDQGWTYSKTEGDDSPTLAAEPVQLMDGLKVTWTYDKYPGQPTPAIVTGQLIAASADDLPELAVGDYLQLDITRPAAGGGDPIVWLSERFVSDEPVVSTHPRGLVMTFTLVHWLRQLGEATISWYDAVTGEQGNLPPDDAHNQLLQLILMLPDQGPIDPVTELPVQLPGYAALELGYRYDQLNPPGPFPDVAFGKVADGTQYLELLTDCLSGVGHNLSDTADHVVLRVMTPEQMAALDIANGGDGADGGYLVWYDFWNLQFAEATWWAYLARIGRDATTGACLQLTTLASGAVSVVQRVPVDPSTLAAIDGLVVNAADVLADDVGFRRNRDDATNQLTLKGVIFDAVTHETSDTSYSVQHADLMERYGAATRTVESHIVPAFLPTSAAALLPEHAAAQPRWTSDGFVWTTRGLTDAELDHYAPLWFPPVALPDPAAGEWVSDMARAVAVLNVKSEWQLAGPVLTGHLTGAVLTISDGDVSVQATVQARPLGTAPDAITWAELRALAGISAAKFRAAAGLSWDATGIAGAEQLTPADLRLVSN